MSSAFIPHRVNHLPTLVSWHNTEAVMCEFRPCYCTFCTVPADVLKAAGLYRRLKGDFEGASCWHIEPLCGERGSWSPSFRGLRVGQVREEEQSFAPRTMRGSRRWQPIVSLVISTSTEVVPPSNHQMLENDCGPVIGLKRSTPAATDQYHLTGQPTPQLHTA